MSYTQSKSGVSSYRIHLLTVSHRRLGVNMPVLRHILEMTGSSYACKRNGIRGTWLWCRYERLGGMLRQ